MPDLRRSAGGARGETSEWLALQCATALRPAETTDALRAGRRPREILASLPPGRAPSPRRLRAAERALARAGAELVPWRTPHYPPGVAELRDAAPVLAVRGDPSALTAVAVGVVGSRAATAYGLQVARRVAGELAAAGVVVVSGLAFGIDAAAHEAALAAGGRTIAVQACGIDRVYPAAHRDLADRIARSGAVVAEFPPGMAPRRAFFPLRNRLISALSRAVVVVEARARSGSLVTARHAADQGVEVLAVPGPITGESHVGCNRLLRDGATPLLGTEDVLAVLAWPSAQGPVRAAVGGSPAARAILAALRHGPASGDELSRQLSLAPPAVAAGLLELELARAIARDRDGRWCATRD